MLGLTRNEEGRSQILRLTKPENFFLSFNCFFPSKIFIKVFYSTQVQREYQDFHKTDKAKSHCVLENSLIFRWQAATSAAKPIFVTRLLHSIRQQQQLLSPPPSSISCSHSLQPLTATCLGVSKAWTLFQRYFPLTEYFTPMCQIVTLLNSLPSLRFITPTTVITDQWWKPLSRNMVSFTSKCGDTTQSQ